jgi:raffinose/stachyose/melibiose transport system permease protein
MVNLNAVRIGGYKFSISKGVLSLVVLALLAIWLYPILLNIITALKPDNEVLQDPLALPRNPSLQAFIKAWGYLDFGTLAKNSFIIAIGSVLLGMVISSVPAYAFSRFRIPGGDFIFLLLLTTLMLPQQTVIIPLYDVLNRLHLLDSLLGIIIVHAAYGMPFNMFVMRGFMAAIPGELESAARVDGCSDFGVYRHIILPLSIPAIAVAATLNFINIWNEFFFAIILMQSQGNFPITVGIITIQQSQYFQSWNTPAAALIMAQLPTIVLYVLAHRYITQGVLAGAVKG